MKNRIYIFVAVAAGMLAVILFFSREYWGGAKVVAKVGQFEITEQMAKDRDALMRQRATGETRSLGLQQLKGAYTSAQILINNGHPIDDTVLQKEEERIDKTTLMPEKLQAIKNIFGDRKDDYRKVFILPVYAERVIYYEFFLNDPRVQAESMAKAAAFRDKVAADPAKWAAVVKDENLKVLKAKVSLSDGFKFIWDEKNGPRGGLIDKSPKSAEQIAIQAKLDQQAATQVSEAGKKWIEELIATLKPGQIVNKTINQGEVGWQVVRYVGPTKGVKNSYDLEVVVFPKRDYAEWHSAEAAKVNVR